MNELELLAGARNADIGIEAVKHGADAVYIGAEKFGARAAAGNSIADIKRLCDFAHLFHARIYVTLNTILKDSELKEAREMICRLYENGADAILIQDMGILGMDIPPIAIHASTQTDNCNPEKVKFLQDIGCSQVVLARECSIDDIRKIRKQTDVRLEAFVHGALCVSYSGRCYASQSLGGRSANRGECLQICRLPFDLQDGEGHSYGTKHWLSLKDLNLSGHIGEMAKAGISSFKIEGRLKDVDYVKNITAFYHRKLNEFIKENPQFSRSSDGECRINFEPDPYRSFNRGFTTYFFNGRQSGINSAGTPKSMGKPVGTVGRILNDRAFTVLDHETLNRQDGLCYFDNKGQFHGVKVNKVENSVVCTASEAVGLAKGCAVYRNSDAEFLKLLSHETADRRIKLDLSLTDSELTAKCGDCKVTLPIDIRLEKANTLQTDNIRRQLSKLGDSVYIANDIKIETDKFFPSSYLSEMRRKMTSAMNEARLASRPKEYRLPESGIPEFPCKSLDYTGNVYNKKAAEFYRKHGVTEIRPAFEQDENGCATLMWSKHCLKYMTGNCKKHPNPDAPASGNKGEPMFLVGQKSILRLKYDCRNCLMTVEKVEA